MKIEVGRKRIMSVLSRNELLHKYEKEIREIDEINKNNKFKHISELNRRLLWNVEEEFVARDKMADSLNIEFDFEDVLKNNIRMVGELGRKFERYKWLKRNLNDLWERIERVDEYNITNKKKLCIVTTKESASYSFNCVVQFFAFRSLSLATSDFLNVSSILFSPFCSLRCPCININYS